MRTSHLFFVLALTFQCSLSHAQHSPALDLLIKNTTLIDVINKKIIPGQYIGIRNNKIVTISDQKPILTAKREIDGSKTAALPGFVNTHTHLWQHICKSCFPNESLQKWVGIYRVVHYLQPQELRKVVLAASSEALLSGITTVSDYSSLAFNDYGFETNAKAISDAGLGGVVIWHNPSIFLPDRIKVLEIKRLQEKLNGQLSIWMGAGPLSFHTLSQIYSGVRLADALHMPLSEHTMENNQEQVDFFDSMQAYLKAHLNDLTTEDKAFFSSLMQVAARPSTNAAYEALVENARLILNTDKRLKEAATKGYQPLTVDEVTQLESLPKKRIISPLEILSHWNSLSGFLSIHSVWPQAEDIEIMKQHNVAISHNPESNLYLSSGMAPIQEYLRAGLTVSIGTDGAASNDRIDFFSAMREMWNVAKVKALNADASKDINEWTVLQAATIGGARALKMDHLTGSIEVGKDADILLVALDELGMAPVQPILSSDKAPAQSNLAAVLVYSGSPKNVKWVVSNGSVVVEDGKLKRYNERDLANDLNSVAQTAGRRKEEGMIWKENYSLKQKKHYWYIYRSIRLKDEIDLKISNDKNIPVLLTIMGSGSTFGGGSPLVADSSALSRYPDSPSPSAFAEKYLLQPGESISIRKRKGNMPEKVNAKNTPMPITIQVNGLVNEHPFQNEQLLILSEDAR